MTTEHSLSSTVQTLPADMHTSPHLSVVELLHMPIYLDLSFSQKDEIWVLCMCHFILTAVVIVMIKGMSLPYCEVAVCEKQQCDVIL